MKNKLHKFDQIIADNLLMLRKRCGYSQIEVATAIGLTRVSICNIETARQSTTLYNLLKFVKLYKCGLSDIIPKEGECPIFLNPIIGIEEERLKNQIERLEAKLTKLKSV